VIAVGVDVGASRLHAVALDDRRRVVAAAVLPATDPGAMVAFAVAARAQRVAVDAPSELSTLPHAGDAALAPKFRSARCGEVALGLEAGVWVPWVSPPVDAADVAGWIVAGLALFTALRAAGLDAIETYPHAVFRTLDDGARMPAKSTPGGLARRAALLRGAGVDEATLPMWGHDGLDAAAAALVALDPCARPYGCGHDGSSIWLPAASPRAGA
jgi:predicted nuclease with RNAse H fold